jgi:hemerythrin
MPILKWDDSFSVGVRQIDMHNQYLLALVASLYQGHTKQSKIENTSLAFAELIDFIVYHFACEEIWMDHTKYSFITEHKEEHKKLYQNIVDIHIDFEHENTLALRKLPSLTKSVIAHIKKYDAAYAHSVANNKLSSSLMTNRTRFNL